MLARGKLYSDASGEAVWVRGVHIDITERVKSDERLHEREAQLAHVSRLTTMGELVAGLAHEINQPLYAINNFANAVETALTSPSEPNREQTIGWVRMIKDADKQASGIIKRVRNYVRQSEYERTPTDVNAILRAAFELIAFQARQAAVSAQWKLAPDLPQIEADRVQLEQVFVNLMRNACEAVSRPENTDRKLIIESRQSGDGIMVTFDDNGPGVPPEERDAIFAAFKSSKEEGLGLGLAISRTITEAHGGSLTVEDSPQGGARFVVRLPLNDASAHLPAPSGVVSPGSQE
jgi:C4-dicarboxylate-specific signal transduction histidine kinase